MPYLSVIVPVYNVEDHLHKCVDSIINQTFQDFEIILVNDGSTDSSPQICEDYLKKDARIKVIHQQNEGVSVARNTGIELAEGDYITFVDSDDWLDAEMYEKMCDITRLEKTNEVVMCDFKTVKGNLKEEVTSELRPGYFSKQQIINEIYPTLVVTEDFGRIPIVSVWSCLFKRSLLVDNRLNFDAVLKYSEDYLFMANVMIKAHSYYYLKGHYYYNYLQYQESRSKKFQVAWWQNLLYLNDELAKLLKDNRDFDFTRQIKLQLLHSVLFILNSISKNQTLDIKTKIREIAFIINEKEVPEAFSKLSFEKQKRTLKIILFLIKNKMVSTYLFFQNTISILKNG